MKKRLLAAVLTIAVLLTLFTACGSKKTEKLDAVKLLSADYEAEYIFAMAGISVDDTKPMTAENGGVYYPVTSDKYKKLADLEALLTSIYAQQSTIVARLDARDADGRALYLDLAGQLCRSSRAVIGTASAELDYDSLEKSKARTGEDGRQTVALTFTEHGGDGAEYRCTMEAVESKDGKWRLLTTRSETPHEVIKKGIGETVADNVRAVADAFVTALAAGDTAAIEQLTQAQGGSYSELSQIGITGASISETVEELDFQGEYLVDLEVSGSGGILRAGKNSYRMRVGYADYDSMLVVRYLQPADFAPYDQLPAEQQTDVAANQVTFFTRLVGDLEFATPAQLSPEIITEYTLWLDDMQNGPDPQGMSLEVLQAQVKRYFGLEGFDPGADSNFYNADTNSYFMLGRGLPPYNLFVTPLSDGDGVATVQVTAYDLAADPLMLKQTATTLYTLNNNWNGSYTFASGVKG